MTYQRIGPIMFFLFLEIIGFYFLPSNLAIFMKFIPTFMLFWFYLNLRRQTLTNKDKLFLISLLIGLIGEVVFIYNVNSFARVLLLLIYLIEHQLYISIFREEKAIIIGIMDKNNLLRVLPYLLISFLFFGFLLMPNVPDNNFILVLIYSVQMAIVGALSAMRKVNRLSYIIMLVSISFLFISDSLTSVKFFVGNFVLDTALIRFFYFTSKISFAEGLLRSYETTNLQEKADK